MIPAPAGVSDTREYDTIHWHISPPSSTSHHHPDTAGEVCVSTILDSLQEWMIMKESYIGGLGVNYEPHHYHHLSS